jgi:outer membrane receptor protein involved in Fe transport
MAYASYSNGFKAGGYSGSASANAFGPETVNAYEVGLKGTFLDHTLSVNADVFLMNYNGLQETAYTQTLSSLVLNAAGARSDGVEIDANWRATPNISFNADLGYLNAVYKNFKNAPCASLTADLGTCGTPSTGPQNMDGKRRGYAPEWSGGVGAMFLLPAGEYEFRAAPSVAFSSWFFENSAADPLLEQSGFVKYNLRLSFGPSTHKWEVAVVGKNLSNRETFGQLLQIPLANGSVWGSVDPGRSVALQFSAHR